MRDLDLTEILMRVPALLIALTIHEFSHGLAAYKLGDSTAKLDGRLSLNPLRHLDPLGTILLLVAQIGWAKPVMVDPRYLKNPKRDMALIAFSGPLSNFLLAFLSLLIAYPVVVLLFTLNQITAANYLFSFAEVFVAINTGLGVFNLIPLPPLDGSKVFASFLPENLYIKFMSLNQGIMMIVVLVLAYFGLLSKLLTPIFSVVLDVFWFITTKIYFFL